MKQQPELTVEEVPTESLIPYARNAKIHTNEQIDQICESIGEFGFNDPVAVWDGPDGPEIIEGHGRVMAAKKLGLDVVPVVRLDHLSDEQRRAYGIVHNKLTMNTGWDFAKLDEELGGASGDGHGRVWVRRHANRLGRRRGRADRGKLRRAREEKAELPLLRPRRQRRALQAGMRIFLSVGGIMEVRRLP